jgi:hypothetical protein
MNEEDKAKKEQNQVKRWFSELEDARKRDETFRKEGKRINEIYESDDNGKVPFNILYSNTDTLLPALYSAQPRPVVQRRFDDPDPIAKAASDAGRRVLEFMLDTNIDGYETFNEGMQSAVIDALLPGRGVTLVKYDAEIGEYLEHESGEVETLDSDEAEDAKDPELRKESELVCIDSLPWDKVLLGYAKKWSKVPWVAIEEVIDKEEAIRLFGEDMAKKIKFTTGDDDDSDSNKDEDDNQGERKTATIYQIWDKDGGRKVRYVSKHYKDGFLKVDDDPLELTGFYPIPKPLQFLAKSNSLCVTALYLIYENQAKELNDLTVRISKIVKAIRAKGIYDKELGGDIENLMQGDDNTLVPADKSATMTDGGFEKSIWFMPVEQLVKVLRELVAAREQCKQVIYEVTGISDIIRGSTVASETATAQNIKSQWGSMRLKRSQAEVQRYARDLLRIMLEVAATKFSEDAWVKMTGLPFATSQQVMEAQAVLQAFKAQQILQNRLDGQQNFSDGKPMPMTVPTMVQQAQQVMQQPKWGEVLELLKNDMSRSYRIDIETNSTIIPEATEDKQKTTEAITALSQFIGESMPALESGYLPFDSFKSIMLKIARQFEFGTEIEGELDKMQAPPPKQPEQDNSLQVKQAELQAKAQADQVTLQAEQQKAQANNMLELQKLQAQNELEAQRMENDRAIEQGKAATEMRMKQMELESMAEIERYKADLDAKTRLEIASIQALHPHNQPEE